MKERPVSLILLGVVGFVILAWGGVPLLGKIVGANLGGDVVGQIRLATDLNPWVEKILLILITIVTSTIFIKFSLSFSWIKQLIGCALIGLIWLATYGYLAFETSDPVDGPWFDTQGKPLRCYVLHSGGVRLLYLVERDPRSGQTCHPVTAELEPRLRRWMMAQRKAGGVLQLRPVPAPSQFFSFNGAPLVWFYARKDGLCEYFELPGVHPTDGTQLKDINAEDLARCRAKEAIVRKNEEKRALADEEIARRKKYVGAPVRRGSSIVATSELGSLTSAALEALRERGHVVVMKPAFAAEGLFDSVWNGGQDLKSLGLEQGSSAVLIRPAGAARITRSPEVGGFTFLQQAFSVLVVRPPYTAGVQSAAFTAEGRGFSEDTARSQLRADFIAKLRSSVSNKLPRSR